MKLWHLHRISGTIGWDEVDGFVVCASGERAARRLASEEAGDEGAGVWLDSTKSSCEQLSPEPEAAIILRSCNAG